MLVDEMGIVKGFGEIGEDDGMDTAKRPSWFYPLFSKCYETKFYHKILNLTALVLQGGIVAPG